MRSCLPQLGHSGHADRERGRGEGFFLPEHAGFFLSHTDPSLIRESISLTRVCTKCNFRQALNANVPFMFQ